MTKHTYREAICYNLTNNSTKLSLFAFSYTEYTASIVSQEFRPKAHDESPHFRPSTD